jgi:glycosyltransferase involved in cell wall biosynthesis
MQHKVDENKLKLSVIENLKTILKTIGVIDQGINNFDSKLSLGENYDFFFKASKNILTDDHRASFLFLSLFLRYPQPQELKLVAFQLRYLGTQATLSGLLEKELPAIGKVIGTNPDVVYVEVTHTSQYMHNSGIQRVVRSLCAALRKNKKNIKLINWVAPGRPFILPEKNLSLAVTWKQPIALSKTSRGFFKNKWIIRLPFLKTLIKRFFTLPSAALIPASQFLIDHLLYETNLSHKLRTHLERYKLGLVTFRGEPIEEELKNKVVNAEEEVLVFWKTKFFVPELVCEDYRYEAIFGLREAGLIELSCVIYDLIPVFNPEFCVPPLRAQFVQYLKILRYADRISCISESIAQELRSAMKCVSRRIATEPLIEAHLLAGDFSNQIESDLESAKAIPADNLPMVLCVGTLEPRKNGRNVLRAAVSLMKQGLKFRLIFAGNPGWLAAEFMEEVRKYQNEGLNVLVFNSVSEGFLKYLYQNTRVSMFCSFAEGFGLPILESLHFNKPVITSHFGSMKEIADHFGGCIQVDPFSIHEIAESIKAVVTDDLKYQSLVRSIHLNKAPTWDSYSESLMSFVDPAYGLKKN